MTSADEHSDDNNTDLGRLEGLDIGSDSFVRLDGLSDHNSVVVPVLADDGGETIRVVGSAFCIHGSGLWVTARHVIEDAVSVHRDAPIYLLWAGPETTGPPPSWLDWDDVPPEAPQRRGALIPLVGWTKDDNNGSDLALLSAGMVNEDGEPHVFPVCRLSARVPRSGKRVRALGYAAAKVTGDIEDARIRRIALAQGLTVSQGEVLEVFREGRDTFRDLDGRPTGALPTVCFETSARFDGGMSGGPVVDADGTVCGIVSRGGGTYDRSFASATPFLFTLHVPQKQVDPLTVYQLAQAGRVAVDGYFEQLIITYEENGQGAMNYPCEDDDATGTEFVN